MSALPIMVIVLCVLAIAYRFYSAFLATKVAVLDDTRVTPAHELEDGQNYHPTNKWVLFGHHFAAISGAGPLIGPVLAVQFGYMPGLIWLLVGVCLAGAVQDFLVLAASLRHKGRSLAQIAREQIGPVSGAAGIAAIIFITVVALAGLGSVVVKALSGEEVKVPASTRIILPAKSRFEVKSGGLVELPSKSIVSVPVPSSPADDKAASPIFRDFTLSLAQEMQIDKDENMDRLAAASPGATVPLLKPAKLLIPGSAWGVFTICASIPIALLMGLWMYVIRKNSPSRIVEASVIGVVLLLSCVQIGSYIRETSFGPMLNFTGKQVIVGMALYGFTASILPVWLLLCPRDYLSSYLKIGTIAALIFGVLIVNPTLESPMYVTIWEGNGPNVKGNLFPFLFIIIMCGSISGFHALVSSGTTPKMVDKESDARMIGYGAMLMEGLVGIVALIAAASLAPGDYYAIQIPMEQQAARAGKLKLIQGDHDNLQEVELKVGENLRGRTGGAVTLAVGMAKIFQGIPFFSRVVGYWYHFAIMFEALFILTTIDTGTRIGRFLVQEVLGKIHAPLGRVDWWPGTIISTLLVVLAWAGLLWNNDVGTIWGMFGIANQLLAVVALCVATTVTINAGRARYVPVTLLPLCFIVSTTLTAGVQMIQGYWLMSQSADSSTASKGMLNTFLIAVMLLCVVVILGDSIRAWFSAGRTSTTRAEALPA